MRIIFFFLLVLIAWDFLFFSGYYMSDDASYWHAILKLNSGQLPTRGIVGYRLVTTFPAFLVYYMSGNFFLTTASFILYHLALCLLAYFLGCFLHSRFLGCLSFLLIALYPGFYIYAGAVFPDLPQAFWLALSLSLLLIYQRKIESKFDRRSFFLLFLCGLCIGLAYGAKISAIVFCLPAGLSLFFIHYKEPKNIIFSGLSLSLGILSYITFETLLFYYHSNFFGLRIFSLSQHSDHYLQKMESQGVLPWDRLKYFWGKIFSIKGKRFWGLFFAASILLPFWNRKNKDNFISSLILSSSFLLMFLYLTFGSTNFSEYRPPSIQARYYAVCILPGALMGAWFVVLVFEKLKERFSKVLAGFFLLIVLVYPIKVGFSLAANADYSHIYGSYRSKAFLKAMEDIYSWENKIVLTPYLKRRMRPILTHNKIIYQSLGEKELPLNFWLIRLPDRIEIKDFLLELELQGYKLKEKRTYKASRFKWFAIQEALMPWTGELKSVLENRIDDQTPAVEALHLVKQ